MERNASTVKQDLERDDIEGHLLELLKPIHGMQSSLSNCGKSSDRRSPSEVASPKRLWPGFNSTLQGARRK